LTNSENIPLTRADLIEALRQKVALSAGDASEILEDVLETISEVLQNSGQFIVPNLGRFYIKFTPARPGRNPKTGLSAVVPAQLKPTFNMSRHLRAKMLDLWPNESAPPTVADGSERQQQ
jgi:nucleoid DNA-binding protein